MIRILETRSKGEPHPCLLDRLMIEGNDNEMGSGSVNGIGSIGVVGSPDHIGNVAVDP